MRGAGGVPAGNGIVGTALICRRFAFLCSGGSTKMALAEALLYQRLIGARGRRWQKPGWLYINNGGGALFWVMTKTTERCMVMF